MNIHLYKQNTSGKTMQVPGGGVSSIRNVCEITDFILTPESKKKERHNWNNLLFA